LEKDGVVKAKRVAIGLWLALLAGLAAQSCCYETAEYGQKRNRSIQFIGATGLRAVTNTMS
jgi:hypothetical protein